MELVRRAPVARRDVHAPAAFRIDLVPCAHDDGSRHFRETLDVRTKRSDSSVVGQVLLQQLGFEGPEDLCLVVSEVRLDPVLRIEKHLSIRFPDAVVLHPLPPAAVDVFGPDWHAPRGARDRAGTAARRADRADGLLDARRTHAGAHLDVDEVVVEEIVGLAEPVMAAQIVDQRIALARAQHIGHLLHPR